MCQKCKRISNISVCLWATWHALFVAVGTCCQVASNIRWPNEWRVSIVDKEGKQTRLGTSPVCPASVAIYCIKYDFSALPGARSTNPYWIPSESLNKEHRQVPLHFVAEVHLYFVQGSINGQVSLSLVLHELTSCGIKPEYSGRLPLSLQERASHFPSFLPSSVNIFFSRWTQLLLKQQVVRSPTVHPQSLSYLFI